MLVFVYSSEIDHSLTINDLVIHQLVFAFVVLVLVAYVLEPLNLLLLLLLAQISLVDFLQVSHTRSVAADVLNNFSLHSLQRLTNEIFAADSLRRPVHFVLLVNHLAVSRVQRNVVVLFGNILVQRLNIGDFVLLVLMRVVALTAV